MSVNITWMWICDLCGTIYTISRESEPYTDEMVPIPSGWNVSFEIPEEYRPHPTHDICDACPECQVDTNWNKTLLRRYGND